MNRKLHSIRIGIIAALFAACVLCASCTKADRVYPETVEELDGLRVGIMTGSIQEEAVLKNFPNSPRQYFNNKTDLTEAVIANKIDYFLNAKISARNIVEETKELKIIDKSVYENEYAYIFKKNDEKAAALKAQLDEYIGKFREDGTLDELKQTWFEDPAVVSHPPAFDVPSEGENGTLVMAIASTQPPYAFMYDNRPTGHDLQLACMFCEEYGYGLRFTDSDFAGIIPAVSSGKADFGGACITVTEERAQSVDFSETYAYGEQVPMVANKGALSNGFFERLKKTFIVENRWKLILSGLSVTLLIALSAAVFGTALGFGLFLLCRKGGKVFNDIIDKITWIFSGLPMVVILMILYYVIFADSSISGAAVASIAFSISTMLGVNAKLLTSVKSIEKGQIEGALSLGFTDAQTLFTFVLPQAMTQFMPNYLSSLIELIKGTSIVGYIAVQDLTKASDIIRSRTYDAFFPLVSTALIYLLTVIVITAVLKKAVARMEPKNRSNAEVLRRFGK